MLNGFTALQGPYLYSCLTVCMNYMILFDVATTLVMSMRAPCSHRCCTALLARVEAGVPGRANLNLLDLPPSHRSQQRSSLQSPGCRGVEGVEGDVEAVSRVTSRLCRG